MKFESMFVLLTVCICACAQAQCPTGDLNLDGKTGFDDLKMLGKSWLSTSQAIANLGGGPDVN
ncbi:MAG: hypothetical protein E4H48_06615 [Syntrophobacterales bacterium]|nr:MAG: hypothetical protein E4H48_06615 [Syntrophobacterales bacterium]